MREAEIDSAGIDPATDPTIDPTIDPAAPGSLVAAGEAELALAITIERETTGGDHWCPRPAADRLRRAIMLRDRSLSGLARRAARLARVLDHVARARRIRGGYVMVLCRLPILRARWFTQLFTDLANQGQLPAAVTVSPNRITLADPGSERGQFELDFNTMSDVAAYLDAVHNMLGYDRVQQILDPYLRDTASGEAVADTLNTALRAWLSPRLVSQHIQRKREAIRRQCDAAGVAEHRHVTDALILRIWQEEGLPDTGTEGLTLFRNAAQEVLAYRRAVRIADETEASGRWAVSLGGDPEAGGMDEGRVAADGGYDFSTWISPLAALGLPPCDRVKWIKKAHGAALGSFMMLDPPADGTETGDGTEGSSLFGHERPDPALCLTVLRADVFGPLQNRLVEQQRKGRPRQFDPGQDYATVAGILSERQDWVGSIGLAALHVLLSARVEGAVDLVSMTDPLVLAEAHQRLVAAGRIAADPDDGTPERMALSIARARDSVLPVLEEIATTRDPAVVALRKRAAAAYDGISVEGLRKQDRGDPDCDAALAAGAPWLARLSEVIAGQRRAMGARDLAEDFAQDLPVFTAALRGRYATDSA